MAAGYRQYETSSDVTVDTDWTDVLEVYTDNGRAQAVHWELINEGGSTALSDLRLLAKRHPDGSYFTFSTEPKKVLTADPSSLAHSTTSRFSTDVGTVWSLKLQVKVASGTTTVSAKAMTTVRPLGAKTVLNVADIVTVTSSNKSLSTLGVTTHPDLKKLMLYPASSGISFTKGTAVDGTSAWLHSNGLVLDCDKFDADQLGFITGSADIKMVVIQVG